MHKTNVMRILDLHHISYTVKEYPWDSSDLSAVHAANALGFDPEQVFKTLAVQNEKKQCFIFCIPAGKELHLKVCASLIGSKKIALAPVKDLQTLTGYVRGGCSPIGLKKEYPIWIDDSCFRFSEISVSAGMRGKQVLLSPASLIDLLKANTASVTSLE